MESTEPFVGIDFGTTNSAVALAGRDGQARLATLPGPGGAAATTWRTVLHFEPDHGEARAGAPAIDRYLEVEGEGRLVQSLKSHLASASFTSTTILGRTWPLEALVAEFLRQLRGAVAVELGRRAVIGRPVRYWGATDADDEARALARMGAALAGAGFDEVVFEFEPAAAAARYAERLDHQELILVADFGGGTSDFSLVRVGPGLVAGAPGTLLGAAGVGIGGDSFDARVIDARVAPALGRGSSYRDELGAATPVPAWLYTRLRRWHHLSFLKAPDTMRLLDRLARGALEPVRIGRLVRLVRDDLGLPLHQAVERAKLALSAGPESELEVAALGLRTPIARAELEAWIAAELAAIDELVAGLLARAGVAAGDVDRVFATGGSSLVPAVRRSLADRFGPDKLVGGDELTSVARGLALRARQLLA
jgi:hypothetical chaperone protein